MRAENTVTDLVWRGYHRTNGSVGLRNTVLALSIMDNANPVVTKVAHLVPGVKAIRTWYGRGHLGEDFEIRKRTLVGLGANPNVAGVLVVGLESKHTEEIADGISAMGQRVFSLSVQDVGGLLKAAYQGALIVAQMVEDASGLQPEAVPLSRLVVGVECGGSDTTSGLVSNPVIGRVIDWLVDRGASGILSESPEFIGAEDFLINRAETPDVGQEIRRVVERIETYVKNMGGDHYDANPGPDNVRGGLTTLEEKSLGAIQKGGSGPIRGVLSYAERPSGSGLFVMDTPSPAVESMTGLAAAGAHLILFSTGKGNVIGNPVSPVIKVCANPETVIAMPEHIDVDLSDVLRGEVGLEVGVERVKQALLRVSRGRWTRCEVFADEEIAISRFGFSL